MSLRALIAWALNACHVNLRMKRADGARKRSAERIVYTAVSKLTGIRLAIERGHVDLVVMRRHGTVERAALRIR